MTSKFRRSSTLNGGQSILTWVGGYIFHVYHIEGLWRVTGVALGGGIIWKFCQCLISLLFACGFVHRCRDVLMLVCVGVGRCLHVVVWMAGLFIAFPASFLLICAVASSLLVRAPTWVGSAKRCGFREGKWRGVVGTDAGGHCGNVDLGCSPRSAWLRGFAWAIFGWGLVFNAN